jgi:hypothetical protein
MKGMDELFDENLMFERIGYASSSKVLTDLFYVKETMELARTILLSIPSTKPLFLIERNEKVKNIDYQLYYVEENIKITINVLRKYESLSLKELKLTGQLIKIFNN